MEFETGMVVVWRFVSAPKFSVIPGDTLLKTKLGLWKFGTPWANICSIFPYCVPSRCITSKRSGILIQMRMAPWRVRFHDEISNLEEEKCWENKAPFVSPTGLLLYRSCWKTLHISRFLNPLFKNWPKLGYFELKHLQAQFLQLFMMLMKNYITKIMSFYEIWFRNGTRRIIFYQ